MSFSQEALRLLAMAGWAEDRRQDISRYMKGCSRIGYALSPHIISFFERFGGLHVTSESPRKPYSGLPFDFDAQDLLSEMDSCTEYDFLCVRLSLPMCSIVPIGHCFNVHMELLMTQAGLVYAYSDGLLLKVGESGEQAIEALVTSTRFEEVLPTLPTAPAN